MKLEISIDQNFLTWLRNAKDSFNLTGFRRFWDGNILHYEEWVHQGNDAIFVGVLNVGIYLMFD